MSSKNLHVMPPKNLAELKLHNTFIPWTSSPIKYLGVLLDKRLTWKPHINATANKVSAKISKLFPLINARSSMKVEWPIATI